MPSMYVISCCHIWWISCYGARAGSCLYVGRAQCVATAKPHETPGETFNSCPSFSGCSKTPCCMELSVHPVPAPCSPGISGSTGVPQLVEELLHRSGPCSPKPTLVWSATTDAVADTTVEEGGHKVQLVGREQVGMLRGKLPTSVLLFQSL